VTPTRRSSAWLVVVIGLVAMVAALLIPLYELQPGVPPAAQRLPRTDAEEARRLLFRQLQPVKLANCELERFGEKHDGGYLLCANLLGSVAAGYSYGISGYDGWGCDVSRKVSVAVHQYDCFDLTQPVCQGGRTVFHGECIGTTAGVQEGRPFDTLAGQIAKNGDSGKRLVVKIDVEGAEWDSFLTAPDEVLERIDQMAVEFHGFDRARYMNALLRLKQFFHVAHLHWNNYSCLPEQWPFPAWAYEVLFVSRRIAIVDVKARVVLPSPLDAPNDPTARDCQIAQ
jgi:hypothetical protein